MPPAVVAASQPDRASVWPLMMPPTAVQPAPATMTEASAKDAIIAWFRGEFAAANAIIDSLCNHLTQLECGGRSEYESVFTAVHRRRLNWIPILQMQKYYSIADIVLELRRVAEKKVKDREETEVKKIEQVKVYEDEHRKNPEVSEEDSTERNENDGSEAVDEDSIRNDSSPESEITDTGSQGVPPTSEESIDLCSNHEDCDTRLGHIKMTKGFIAKEHVKGHMVNVVRGLKMYEDIFTDCEVSKLNDFVNELRLAGQKGELSGETFILYNQQVKGKKRELIQFGDPIFGHMTDETTEHEKSHIEPIPTLLQGVIDHLVQWHLISENRKPNSCIINFFDEGEFSQPFLKPPHLEQPISTLLLSESRMAFGRTLVCDNDGNYKGSLMLSLKGGSVLVMRGNSSDVARHAMCPSPNNRVSITFFRVRPQINQNDSTTIPPLTKAMTLWQPGIPTSYAIPDGNLNGCEVMDIRPKWGVVRAPIIMLAPTHPMVLSPGKIPQGGTGVFLPWTIGSRKPARRLPPRAQKRRFLSLSSADDMEAAEPTCNSGLNADVKMV